MHSVFIILVVVFQKMSQIEGLFEYVCEEEQLYRPYVHIYKGRKGERFLDEGPGFYDLIDKRDIYVCINGP